MVKEQTSGAIQYPMLMRSNYQEWALLMKVNLQATGLWHAVEPEEGEEVLIEYREDRLAMAAILWSMPSKMLGSLARKRTARSAWAAVKTVRLRASEPSISEGTDRMMAAMERPLLIVGAREQGVLDGAARLLLDHAFDDDLAVTSVRSAWVAVKTVHVGVDRVREANTQHLLRQFGDIGFNEGESVDDFSLRIMSLANTIRTLGHDITDAQIMKKMLQVVPEHLEQIAYSIETLLDVNELLVEEVVGRLRAIEQRKKKPASAGASSTANKQGLLLLAEEEWMARLKLREFGEGSGSGKRDKTRRGHGGGSGGSSGGGQDGKGHDGQGKPQERNPDKCVNYGIKGHYAKDCRKPRREQKAHVVEGEEQHALMMVSATATTINDAPSSFSSRPATCVEIHEAEVFAELGPIPIETLAGGCSTPERPII
ncbi:uncharacterized protein [Miscanthus floridulus]|uniref:uncharacterized protein n=1 Tax=Miscanthus floridulus TaxID=154761 RepID=UPI00345AE081